MLNRNHKYINFILEKLRNSLYSSGFDITGTEASKAITFLMSSDDILRDIFILSKYKQCGSLCSYLLFVYKKLDENSLKYENLPVNIEYDVEYLKRIVIGSFKLNKASGETEENGEEMPSYAAENNLEQQWEVSDEISESKFKVGEIERDIVTEEFSEDEIDITQFKDLNPEDEEKIEEIISVSLAEVKESFADEVNETETQNRDERSEQKNTANPEEQSEEEVEAKEEAFDLSDLMETKQPEQIPNDLIDDEKQTEEIDEAKEETVSESANEHEREVNPEDEEELDEEAIIEISSEHLEVSAEEEKEKTAEYEDTHIFEENEILPEKNDEIDEEIPLPDEKNRRFAEFEKRLVAGNLEMTLTFDEIEKLIKNYTDNDSRLKDKSEFISRKSKELGKATSDMTFEIISNMYGFMESYFDKASSLPFEIRQKDVNIFSYSLRVIEKFILEEDFSGIEKVLGDFYEIEKYLAEKEHQKKTNEIIEEKVIKNEIEEETIDTALSEAPVETFEEIAEAEEKEIRQNVVEQPKEQETEKVLYEKKDVTESQVTEKDSRRKMMMVLKAEIMELEIIFKSIDEIEGEYKIYEGLRKLSKTYNILKKTVVLSKRLDMNKLARLSEACYIFIKFIQNYRLSPFDNDIKQIFNYIIYNYKLIALDKPTKDFEEFVFYLNDPVKIFTQKKKN